MRMCQAMNKELATDCITYLLSTKRPCIGHGLATSSPLCGLDGIAVNSFGDGSAI
jgi:hypothetical protein